MSLTTTQRDHRKTSQVMNQTVVSVVLPVRIAGHHLVPTPPSIHPLMPSAGSVHSLSQRHPPVGIAEGHRLQAEERALMQEVGVILRCAFPLSHSATTCVDNIPLFGRLCIYSLSRPAQMYFTVHLVVDLALRQILHHLLFRPLTLLHPHLPSRAYLSLAVDLILDHLHATPTIPILSRNQRLDLFNLARHPWTIHTTGVARARPMNLLAVVQALCMTITEGAWRTRLCVPLRAVQAFRHSQLQQQT